MFHGVVVPLALHQPSSCLIKESLRSSGAAGLSNIELSCHLSTLAYKQRVQGD